MRTFSKNVGVCFGVFPPGAPIAPYLRRGVSVSALSSVRCPVRTYRKAVACVCLCVVLRLVASAVDQPLPGLGDTGAPPRSLRHTSSPNADLLVSPVSSSRSAERRSIEAVSYEGLRSGGLVAV